MEKLEAEIVPTIYIVINEETLQKNANQLILGDYNNSNGITKDSYNLKVNTTDKEGLETTLNQIRQIYNLNKNQIDTFYYTNEQANQKVGSEILLYGLTTLSIFIMITNIINVLYRDIQKRCSEFALFHSIGMKQSQFSKIIVLEYISYFTVSLILGTILAVYSNYIIYKLNFDVFYIFKIPYFSLLFTFIFAFITLTLIYFYISKILKKIDIGILLKDRTL